MANLPQSIDMIIQKLQDVNIPNIGDMPSAIEGHRHRIWTGFNPYQKYYIFDNQDVLNKDLMFRNENPVEQLDFRWVKKILICSEWELGTILHFKKSLVETHTPTYPHWKTTGYKFTWEKITELIFTDDIRANDFFIDEKGYLWTENRDKYELLKINCIYNNEIQV